jgi:hypothetical protein
VKTIKCFFVALTVCAFGLSDQQAAAQGQVGARQWRQHDAAGLIGPVRLYHTTVENSSRYKQFIEIFSL